MPEPVPVIVVCGFLGAGKTTLLQRILTDPQGIAYGVLLNDFGAIDIDGALLARAGTDPVLLNNGCVCCSIKDDLADALDLLLARQPPPERIIVEASGISRPLPVADAIAAERFRGRARLDGIYCLVDAAGFGALDFAATELALDQAVAADLVVLNKTDLAGQRATDAVAASLRDAMPQIRLLPTTQADIPRQLLFSGTERRGPADHHDHDHDHEFETWDWASPLPIDPELFRRAVRQLPAGIMRAKGIGRVAGQDERLVFQLVGKRTEFASVPDLACGSAAVAIGRRGAFEPAALTRLFESCLQHAS